MADAAWRYAAQWGSDKIARVLPRAAEEARTDVAGRVVEPDAEGVLSR